MSIISGNEYFSLMEFLEFLYNQNLPGTNEISKRDYYSIMNSYLFEYSKMFSNNDFDSMLNVIADCSGKEFVDVKNHYKAIHSFKTKGILFGKRNLYPLLIASLEQINHYNNRIFASDMKTHSTFISSIVNQNSEKKGLYEKILRNEKESDKSSLADLESFIEKETTYSGLEIKNIAVCATMSAGKSTLINALLGNDILPSKNEATTAKITSISDKDGLKHLKGFCIRGHEKLFSYNANLETLNSWNSDNKIDYIYVQGDLNGIKNEDKYAVTIYDTPGPNYSGDKSHQNITIDFLSSKEINAIIFVVNAEQIATTDEKFLLSKIYKNKICKDKTPVIFVLNKADCVDTEKEDIKSIIEKYKIYLNEIGFEKPKIFPVSAKAARLMKMASKNKGTNFSKMEQREFSLYIGEFLEDYDFSCVSEDFSEYDENISVGQKEYSMKDVLNALNRTGINAIEKEIESLFLGGIVYDRC